MIFQYFSPRTIVQFLYFIGLLIVGIQAYYLPPDGSFKPFVKSRVFYVSVICVAAASFLHEFWGIRP